VRKFSRASRRTRRSGLCKIIKCRAVTQVGAAEGRALPNLFYPIETHEDASNAITLAPSGHGDAAAAKKLIR